MSDPTTAADIAPLLDGKAAAVAGDQSSENAPFCDYLYNINIDSDENETEEEAQVPYCSKHCNRLKYWYRQFGIPLQALIANVAIWYSVRRILKREVIRFLYTSRRPKGRATLKAVGHSMLIGHRFLLGGEAPIVAVEKISAMVSDKASPSVSLSSVSSSGTTGIGDGEPLDEEDPAAAEQRMRFVLVVGFAVLVVLFLVDAYVCFKNAKRMEQKAKERLEQEMTGMARQHTSRNPTNGGSEEEDIDFIKTSRNVDASFGCTSDSPSSTFLVALLYALFSVAMWLAADNASHMLVAQFASQEKIARCYLDGPVRLDDYAADHENDEGLASLQMTKNFAKLPLDVQDWIKSHAPSEGEDPRRWSHPSAERILPFIHLADGTVVFTYKEEMNGPTTNGVAVYGPSDASVRNFTGSRGFRGWGGDGIVLIGFPSQPPYTGWCAKFNSGYQILQDEVLCYNSKSNHVKRFEPVKDERMYWGSSGGNDKLIYATDDTLWVARKNDVNLMYNSHEREVYISLVAYDTNEMTKTIMAERNITIGVTSSGSRDKRIVNPGCKAWYNLGLLASTMALCYGAVYLYRMDVPSCTVPVTLALAMHINLYLPSSQTSLIMLALSSSCVLLLVTRNGKLAVWKYVSTEMVVWGVYSFMVASSWGGFTNPEMMYYEIGSMHWLRIRHYFLACLAFLELTVITVLLNHPTFQMLSFCCSILGFLSLFVVLRDGFQYVLIPIGLLCMSLGCYKVAGLLQVYRLHVNVYIRRGCRWLVAALKRFRKP